MRARLFLLSLFAACSNQTSQPFTWADNSFPVDDQAPSLRWTVTNFLAEPTEVVGGFLSSELAVDSAPIAFRGPPWDTSAQVSGTGLVPRAAFVDGQRVALAITEVWQNHPRPWVEPVYKLVSGGIPGTYGANIIADTRSLFPVDSSSAFYTPFWQLWWVEVDATNAPSIHSTDDALRAAKGVSPGALVVCPFTASNFSLARGPNDSAPLMPVSLKPLPDANPRQAWANHASVDYTDFGLDRFTATNALPTEVPLYVFVTYAADESRAITRLPFVIADDRETLARRTDVVMTQDMFVLVPASMNEMKTQLESDGLTVKNPPLGVPDTVAQAWALKVFRDPNSCLANAADFPTLCQWVDSRAGVEALPTNRVIQTSVLVTAVTLRAAP